MLTRLSVLAVFAAGCDARDPPDVSVLSPPDGARFAEGEPVALVAEVAEAGGPGGVVVWWVSDAEGLLAEQAVGARGRVTLAEPRAVGRHRVRAIAVDREGERAVAEVAFEVVADGAPQVTLLLPAPGETWIRGRPAELRAEAGDVAGGLEAAWTVGPPGEPDGTGVVVARGAVGEDGTIAGTWTPDQVGRRVVTVTVRAADGATASADAAVHVVEAGDVDADRDGFTPDGGDCDDGDPEVHPGAAERCGDARDEDCDGIADRQDDDRDGHVDAACAPPGGRPADDCDDGDPGVHPGAAEVADGRDQDCDGAPDDGTDAFDADGDCACPGPACTAGVDPTCGALAPLDCDDADADRFPAQAERCDGIDQDCDGAVDDGVGTPTWPDRDRDGWGDAAAAADVACGPVPPRRVDRAGDCDDRAPARHPGRPERACNGVDDDCDPGSADAPDADGDGVDGCEDCDDGDPDRFPGRGEACNGLDDDCDGVADDGLAASALFPDRDSDGYGDGAALPTQSCAAAEGMVADDGDCDDGDPAVHPGAPEVPCDGVDGDCDLATPDAADRDGDGASACGDCDDGDPLRAPHLAELCDARDNDCDGDIDEAVDLVFRDVWPDADGDGHGDPAGLPTSACAAQPGTALVADDCDDTDALRFPGQPDGCDGADTDCDGAIDEDAAFAVWYPDLDQDGFGDPWSAPAVTCAAAPPGHVPDASDCDDAHAAVHPGARERPCNGVDDDCAARTADERDVDHDGVGACHDCDDADPGQGASRRERCDGLDDDCDGVADDGLPVAPIWPDRDLDGSGDAGAAPRMACGRPGPAESAEGGDCDDADPRVGPHAVELACDGVDGDCDPSTPDAPDGDADGHDACHDCDDADPGVFPGAPETCDARDEDCDGLVDDGLPTAWWWPDEDGDGQGDAGAPPTAACGGPPPGGSADDRDCDDGDPEVAADEPEDCDGVDQDCDGLVDDGLGVPWFADADGDGHGDPRSRGAACGPPPVGTAGVAGDCDDGRGDVFPGAAELPADGLDQDCDGVDRCWQDQDHDGVGGAVAVPGTTLSCSAPGEAATPGDCDDADGQNFPGNAERCDGRDNDCADGADEDVVDAPIWPDADGDGWGDALAAPRLACAAPGAGESGRGGDCDDADPTRLPGAAEVGCDGVDQDCDPGTGGGPDLDGDGSPACADCDDLDPGRFPGRPEACDAIDDDCDGVVDGGLPVVTGWRDRDGDGDGDPAAAAVGCALPPGYAAHGTDCDDTDAALHGLDADGDGFDACAGDCDDADPGVFPGAPDPADDAFVDEDCDGWDGVTADAAVASPAGTDVDNGACEAARPCRTFGHAVGVAAALGLPEVWLVDGTYAGVPLTEDVRVVGGYAPDGSRGRAGEPGHRAVLTGGWSVADGQFEALAIRGADVTLADLVVVGPDAVGDEDGGGRSSYAIRADAASTVRLERCELVVGRGADGLDGADGADAPLAPATAGGAGAPGRPAFATCEAGSAEPGRGGGEVALPGAAGGGGGRGGRPDSVCCGAGCDPSCGDCTAQRGSAGEDAAEVARSVPSATWWGRYDPVTLAPLADPVAVAWSDAVEATAPDVAILPDGFALAWVEKYLTGTETDQWVRLGVWRGDPPVRHRLLTLAGDLDDQRLERPVVAADRAGRMFVAWFESAQSARAWAAALDADGDVLVPPHRLVEGPAALPVVEFLDDDHVALAWRGPVSEGNRTEGIWVTVRTFPDGAERFPPVLLSAAEEVAERPAMAVRDRGDGRFEASLSWEGRVGQQPLEVHGVVLTWQL